MNPTTGSIKLLSKKGKFGTAIIAVPGLLSNERFFEPVLDELLQHGTLMRVAFTGENGFDGWATAQSIAKLIEATANLEENRRVVLIGASLGGLLLVEACRHLPQETRSKLRLIIVDAPTGGNDVYGEVNRVLARAMRFMPKGSWVESPGKRVMEQILIPPKRENIEDWNPETNYDYLGGWPANADQRDREIIDFALNNMLENPFRRYTQQIAWIVEAGKRLDWSAVRDIPSGVYLACTGGANETIVQPQASKRWSRLTGMRVIAVPEGAHAALAEQPTLYRGVLGDTITALT